ncbi:MAG: polyprenyl synthetase family protein [Rickettsiaceae bacterium]|nr:polyprenyl synthetase family protein [Rickettsiaceae bacterium]
MAKTYQINIENLTKNLDVHNLIRDLQSRYHNSLERVTSVILSKLECGQTLIKEAASHLISLGGKRIRPLLVVISTDLCKSDLQHSDQIENTIMLAAATELIHTATLLHDDVIDESLQRRFRPTVNSIWGNKEAILVGDFLFSCAFGCMVLTNSIEALEILSKTSSLIAKGEIQQLTLNKNNYLISEKEYFEVISSKTAELFAAACKIGAVITNRDQDTKENLFNFGINLGSIFQIRDDSLDYIASKVRRGKNLGEDFFEGKITLPVIYLEKSCNQEEKEFLSGIFSKHHKRTIDQFNEVINLLTKYNIQHRLDQKIKDLTEACISFLEKIHSNNLDAKEYLKQLVYFAGYREE